MNQFVHRMRYSTSEASFQFLVFLVRAISGLLLGLTMAIAGQEAVGFGNLLFMFIVVTTTGVSLRLTKGWGLLASIIILLVLVLAGVLLKLYIHTAMGG